jgi:acyl dehydratase
MDELADRIGQELGVSEWVTVDQERINRFAEATGDHQWIHVDTDRARAGPYGMTIAHGYLTLSLVPIFLAPLLELDGLSMSLNYGVDRVRFPSPVRVGSRLRGRFTVESVKDTAQGVRLEMACVMEIDGGEKPACVAHPIALLVRSADPR